MKRWLMTHLIIALAVTPVAIGLALLGYRFDLPTFVYTAFVLAMADEIRRVRR